MIAGNILYGRNLTIIDFRWEQESFIAESIFDLIAIACCVAGTDDGVDRGNGTLPIR